MRRSIFVLLAVLSLGLGTPAARAANAYAGKYTIITMATGGPAKSRNAQNGTMTVSPTGAITMKFTIQVSGGLDPVGKTETVTGQVSSAGVVTIPIDKTVKIKFIKSGTTILGFQGTSGPDDLKNTGIIVGLRQP